MPIRMLKAAAAFIAFVAIGDLDGCTKDPGLAIPFTQATVAGAGNDYSIAWTARRATAVSIYAGIDPAKIGRALPVGAGGTTGALDFSPPAASPPGRWYFELVPDRGAPLVLARRSLGLASAPNFRDAGGYRAADGKWVRMGLLYRSDQLDRLTPDDLETLHAAGIHLVCDLRTDIERRQGMDRLPQGATAMIANVAGGDGASSGITKLLSSGGGDAQAVLGNGRGVALMMDANRQFVKSQTARQAYKALFERLADPAMLPGVFHCTSGKDRTGWAQAIFLSIMGVPRDVILRDYLLSNDYLAAKNAKMLAALNGRIDPALLEPLVGVRADYLQAGFDAVDTDYGSMDHYIREGLGLSDITIQALRREFLLG